MNGLPGCWADGMRRMAVGVAVLALLWASGVKAYASLFEQISGRARLSGIIPAGNARAEVADGPLIGFGSEQTTVLDNGRLRIEQRRTYTRIRNPQTGKTERLPEPWRTRTRLLVSPTLRLLQADTRLWFRRSADRLFEDYRISEERSDLFELDHLRVVADDAVRHLTSTAWLDGKRVDRERYDYPADSIPIEIAGFSLAAAVHRRVDRFDFDLLLPDGSSHGVRAIVHRTRDMSRFAEGYGLPRKRLRRREEVAVVELRLSSPIKYLLFPHRFYMVYASADPGRLIAVWGGEPGDHMEAFRLD